MRRVLIGLGTPLGYYLASRRGFSECLTYKRALGGLSPCDEALIVVPGSKRPGGNALRPQGRALIAAAAKAARRLVLLSSIDAYPSKGLPFDETAIPASAPGRSWLPLFEREILACGVPSQIVRLPDLFGPYIVKGVPGCVLDGDASGVNRVAIHQFYPVSRLESDLAAAKDIGAPIINLVPQPLPLKVILTEFYPGQIGQVLTPAPYSRIKTRYAAQFGGADGYIMSAGHVLEAIGRHLRGAGKDFTVEKSPAAFRARSVAAGAFA